MNTKNVSALTLSLPERQGQVRHSGHAVDHHRRGRGSSRRSRWPTATWTAHFRKEDGKWKVVDKADDGTLAKRHGLQGPIDDAFMDSFLMVKPTGKPINEKVGTLGRDRR